jgi:hypothetical protein
VKLLAYRILDPAGAKDKPKAKTPLGLRPLAA